MESVVLTDPSGVMPYRMMHYWFPKPVWLRANQRSHRRWPHKRHTRYHLQVIIEASKRSITEWHFSFSFHHFVPRSLFLWLLVVFLRCGARDWGVDEFDSKTTLDQIYFRHSKTVIALGYWKRPVSSRISLSEIKKPTALDWLPDLSWPIRSRFLYLIHLKNLRFYYYNWILCYDYFIQVGGLDRRRPRRRHLASAIADVADWSIHDPFQASLDSTGFGIDQIWWNCLGFYWVSLVFLLGFTGFTGF